MASPTSSVVKIGGKNYEDILIGSDPEFRIKGLKARLVLPYEGEFGADGPNSEVGELRPEPTFCPINHVYKIELILRDGFRRYPSIRDLDWLGGTMPDGHPIGGHIHIGSTYKKDLELKLEAMDKLLAPIGLMLENPEEAQRRRSGQYGRLVHHNGKFSEKDRGFKTKEHYHGSQHALSHGGYEYRPLSSWLVSKQVASGLLCLAKVIAFQTHNKDLSKHLGTQLKFIQLNKEYSDAFVTCDKKYFLPMIPTIYRIVSTFALFEKYEKYINYIFSLIYQNRTWNEKIDMKKRWNVVAKISKNLKKSLINKKYTIQEIFSNPFGLPILTWDGPDVMFGGDDEDSTREPMEAR